jgi:hypothetical protein
MTSSPKWWQWPTILSFDAPAVALAWQALVARAAGVRLAGPPAAVLGLSVWLAYAADRWLEGWRLRPDQVRTQRHLFYQRNRWPVAALWVAALAGDVAVACAGLTHWEFWFGAGLLPAVVAYVISHQFVHRDRPWRLPKEICVALLLAGGVAAFVAADRTDLNSVGVQARPPFDFAQGLRAVGLLPSAVLVPAGLFFVLAFANCALISVWERAVDQSHGQISLARQFAVGPLLGRSAAWLALVCGAAAAIGWPVLRGAGLCAAASGAALLLVDGAQNNLGWEAARVMADVVLLTPVVVLGWPR